MKRKKGFTLIELIIAMALTLVVMGVASTFFINTIKAFKKAEISSKLQEEAEKIEGLFLTVGLQSEGLDEVNNLNITSSQKRYYRDVLDGNGKIQVENLRLKLLSDYYTLEYKESTGNLKARKENNGGVELVEDGYPKDLSENISKFTIRPIDFRMNEDGSLYEAKAIEINLTLKDTYNKSEVEVPLSLIIKFRNK